MNKILIFGIGVVLIVGAIIFFRQNVPKTNKTGGQKEIKVGSEVCSEFPKEWVQSVINKTIVKTEAHNSTVTNTCQYYLDESDFVTLRLNNFVAMQDDKVINDIVLEINPNLFLAVDRSSTKAASESEILNFAIKVAERIKNGENQGLVSAPTVEPTKKIETNVVPLPQETDIVNNFITFIDEGKASGAVMMMTSNITNDDSTKQAYGVQYAAMTSVKVKKIEESSKGDWTETRHQYMVTLDIVMDPSSANGPIPYYGYEKGENVRFINLVKEGSLWKIEGLSTGP